MQFTTVVVVDRRTIQYLLITSPTWPEVVKQSPWLIVYDGGQQQGISKPNELRQLLGRPGSDHVMEWVGATYETQRERMLTAHVYASALVETEWMLKIDCDSFHDGRTRWPDPSWFNDDAVLIGNSWGYWRAKGGGGDLEDWVETLESFGDRHYGTPRAGWSSLIGSRDHPKGPKLKETRLASWICFQKTKWVHEVAAKFAEDYGDYRLPVPSHDTSLWAAARRSNSHVRLVQAKNYGWHNRTTLRGCVRAIQELR
jgi:hypothetical protein